MRLWRGDIYWTVSNRFRVGPIPEYLTLISFVIAIIMILLFLVMRSKGFGLFLTRDLHAGEKFSAIFNTSNNIFKSHVLLRLSKLGRE